MASNILLKNIQKLRENCNLFVIAAIQLNMWNLYGGEFKYLIYGFHKLYFNNLTRHF